jgi:exonuclease III
MSILSWNCHGLEQSATVQELIALVRAKSPGIVFLTETRSASRAMNLKWRLGLNNSIGVDSNGQGGGIVLFRHESLEVVVLGLSPHFIDIRVNDVESSLWNRITFVYGEPRVESRHLMWESLP